MKNERKLKNINFKDAANASFFMAEQYGLIGLSLKHSFSETYFKEKFLKEKITATYKNYELKQIDDLKDLLRDKPSLKGLNVTIPYKQSVIPLLDKIDKTAKKIGAVNCIKISQEGTEGYNTDVIGFEKSIKPLLKDHHTKALILGTGGAAQAVKFVLRKLDIEFLSVSRVGNKNVKTYEKLNEEILLEYTIIINTTPLGAMPYEHYAPMIPYEYITDKHLMYDLIYNPSITEFLKHGQQKGATIKNGLEMLEIQAEESWKIWHQPTV